MTPRLTGVDLSAEFLATNQATAAAGLSIDRRRSDVRDLPWKEVLRTLAAVGFGSCEGFGSLEAEPFRLGSPRLILVAQKT